MSIIFELLQLFQTISYNCDHRWFEDVTIHCMTLHGRDKEPNRPHVLSL